MNVPPALCAFCRHRREEDISKPSCTAYPDGIPMRYWHSQAHHTELTGEEAEPVAFEMPPDATNDLKNVIAEIISTGGAEPED